MPLNKSIIHLLSNSKINGMGLGELRCNNESGEDDTRPIVVVTIPGDNGEAVIPVLTFLTLKC